MNILKDSYFDTLSQTIDAVIARAADERAIVVDGDMAISEALSEPLAYGQQTRKSFPLVTLKERKTRKHLQVVIHRLESGRYELVNYIL